MGLVRSHPRLRETARHGWHAAGDQPQRPARAGDRRCRERARQAVGRPLATAGRPGHCRRAGGGARRRHRTFQRRLPDRHGHAQVVGCDGHPHRRRRRPGNPPAGDLARHHRAGKSRRRAQGGRACAAREPRALREDRQTGRHRRGADGHRGPHRAGQPEVLRDGRPQRSRAARHARGRRHRAAIARTNPGRARAPGGRRQRCGARQVLPARGWLTAVGH